MPENDIRRWVGRLELTTFSITARCRRTGMLGVAVATAVPAVGSNCPWVDAGAGAIASQAWVNPYLGIDGLQLLRAGGAARDVLDVVLASDPYPERRQIGIVDRDGGVAAHTGEECTAWHGHRVGAGFTVQGNMLAGGAVLSAMETAYLTAVDKELPERLLEALEAGEAAGGDHRGRQSAALRVTAGEAYPYVDLRVDEHVAPVTELRRVFEVASVELLPFVRNFPTRSEPAGRMDPNVAEMLARQPRRRA